MITKDEWNNDMIPKYCIVDYKNTIKIKPYYTDFRFLAFRNEEQAKEFIEKYTELVKQYLGIEE